MPNLAEVANVWGNAGPDEPAPALQALATARSQASPSRAMGIPASRAEIFDFPETREQVKARIAEYVETKPDVVCIDGLPGLTRVSGINGDANAEVERLFSEVMFPLKNAGVAVVLLDHLPKDAVNEDFPIGAQAKKAQSGVAYLLKAGQDPHRTSIFVTKDRHHQVRSRADEHSTPQYYYGSVALVSEGTSVSVAVLPMLVPELDNLSDSEMSHVGQMSGRSAMLRTAIWEFVAANPDCSLAALERKTVGKTAHIRAETDWLIQHGFLTRTGKGLGYQHRVGKPFKLNWKPSGPQIDS